MADIYQHLSTLSEPIRVRLLALLAREELGVGELTRIVQLPQSTVSRHLKALQLSGWVRRRAVGTAGWYRHDPQAVDDAAREIWAVLQRDFAASLQHTEDDSRLQAALADRQMDGDTFFGKMRDQWDRVRTELWGDDFALPTLLSLLPDGLKIADLGCGTGEALVRLAPVVDRVIGVDREQAMLDVAAERTKSRCNVDLRLGGIASLPLEDDEVDAALCMLVLHHVSDLSGAFEELRRVVRAGGRIVVLDMVAHDRSDYRHTMGHAHLGFERQDLEDTASAAGLRLATWRRLRPAAAAQGPPLFVATFR